MGRKRTLNEVHTYTGEDEDPLITRETIHIAGPSKQKKIGRMVSTSYVVEKTYSADSWSPPLEIVSTPTKDTPSQAVEDIGDGDDVGNSQEPSMKKVVSVFHEYQQY